MDFSLFLLAFTVLWEMSHAIQCFKCSAEYIDPETPLCAHFDGSQRFIVDCPSSTGCTKKETLLNGFGENTKSEERACALQTMDGEQEKIEGRWQHVHNIHEVYDVGCKEDPTFGKLTRTTKCFCRGDLCNSSSISSVGISVLAASLFMMWIAH